MYDASFATTKEQISEKSGEKQDGDDSEFYGSFYFRTRLKTAFTKKEIMGKPIYKQFEDYQLPIPEKYDEYLTQMFGDYMTPPAPDKQVGLHLIDVDFGKY